MKTVSKAKAKTSRMKKDYLIKRKRLRRKRNDCKNDFLQVNTEGYLFNKVLLYVILLILHIFHYPI